MRGKKLQKAASTLIYCEAMRTIKKKTKRREGEHHDAAATSAFQILSSTYLTVLFLLSLVVNVPRCKR